MRLDESKIWGLYMESKKVGMKKTDTEKKEKGDKKEDGKGKIKKGKKGLPPWLKNKEKKIVKEGLGIDGESDSGFGEYTGAWNTIDDKVSQIADESCARLWEAISELVYENIDSIISKINNVNLDVGDLNDLEPGEELDDGSWSDDPEMGA